MISSDDNLKTLLDQLRREGKLPSGLSQEQLAALEKSFARWQGQVSDRIIEQILADWQDKIKASQTLDETTAARGIIYDLGHFIDSPEVVDRMRFSLETSQEVASGAGQYLNQNLSPEVLDEFPALQYARMFLREVPRGLERGKKGSLIAVPEQNWPTRWMAAGAAAGDNEWVPWSGDAQGGRGVALKSSGIWQALGDGAGGYGDTLGNPFPPFAFNSGFMTLDVSRQEASALGLIGAKTAARPAKINYSTFFAEVLP